MKDYDIESLRHYEIVKQAIEFIRDNSALQPSLSQVAQAVHLSEYHLQRLFVQWAGISPKRFMQSLTKQRALESLKHSSSLLETAHDVGLSGTGRLHDLMVNCEAMTPGEIQNLGDKLTIEYGVASTPFGMALIAWTTRGICYLQFIDDNQYQKELALKQQWPLASYVAADAQKVANQIFLSEQSSKSKPVNLLVKGTNFQIKVWEALINSQAGELFSYAQIANKIGSPKASRAVGTALASNTIGFLIPCHRVIRADGDVGQFRWGTDRKLAIQGWEAAK
ncbi:methylated-DNA--[protein]-cysteine S-methyltransferase [Vibrio gallicus]|uniref:methylated-DNA--[protein]-cysteine S-methyltransferase n=1 Tax=Vibrio gallicus TaxID=190897 RepID=UPI0021C26610|nr:methylated-DNA--[protein]-cysteine S-methyltransferase [Vibrio gallicus]